MAEQEVSDLNVRLRGDGTSLDRVIDRAEKRLDAFAGTVENIGRRVQGAIRGFTPSSEAGVSGLHQRLVSLVGVLTGVADAVDRVKKGTDQATRSTDAGAASVRRLWREWRAGQVTTDEYVRRLRKAADESEAGSDRQIAALLRLKAVQDQSAKDARRVADEKERASKRAAEAAEDEARRTEAAAQKAARAAKKAAEEQRRARSEAVEKTTRGMETLGAGLTGAVTLPIIGGGAYAVKEGLGFEEAWAEVRKFTDGTDRELSELQKRFRSMATDRVIDTDFEDLAGIAAMASQLGVARENLGDFTAEVVYLGKAGDIAGQEGASGLAKIAAAMKVPQSEFRNLASSVVQMGEMGSSSLGEILDVAKRLASEARLAKLDPSQVMAYANAVVSLGQEPEAAGTALTTTFAKIDRAVNEGGENLKLYAAVAGKSAEEFARAYREDAGRAVQEFFAGLDRQGQRAGQVDRILGALGIKNIREATAVKNLAAGHELLADAMDASAKAYADGDVARQKAAVSASTAASQLRQTKRLIQEEAAAISEDLIPALLDVLKSMRPFFEMVRAGARWFRELSPTQQQVVLGLVAFAAALGPVLVGGARLIESIKVLAAATVGLRTALGGIRLASLGAAGGLEGLAARGASAFAAGAPLALAIIAITGLVAALAYQWWQLAREQDEATQSAADFAEQQRKVAAMGPRHERQMQAQKYSQRLSDKRDELGIVKEKISGLEAGGGGLRRGAALQDLYQQRAVLEREVKAYQSAYDRTVAEMRKLPADPTGNRVPKPPPAPPKPPGPVPNVNVPNKTKNTGTRVPGSVFSPVRMEKLDGFLLPADLAAAATDARTYEPKVRAAEDHYAGSLFAAQQKGDASETYRVTVDRLNALVALSEDALGATSRKMRELEPAIRAGEAQYRSAYRSLDDFQRVLRGKAAAGQKMSEAERRQLERLKGSLKAAEDRLKGDRSEYEVQERVNREAGDAVRRYKGDLAQAIGERTAKVREGILSDLKAKLAAGEISRGDYEGSLKGALSRIPAGADDRKPFEEALAESENDRKAAQKSLADEMARIGKRNGDFDAERQRIKDAAAERRRQGVPEADVAGYEAAAGADVDRREFEAGFREADAAFQAALADGEKAVGEYRTFLEGALKTAAEKFGENSEEASKLTKALSALDWKQAEEEAAGLRRALDEGGLSLETYVAWLRALQATLPETAAAHRKLQTEIDQANRRMREEARRTADDIAGRYADAFTEIATGGKSLGRALGDVLKETATGALRDWVKRVVQRQVLRVLVSSNEEKVQQAAREQQAAATTFVSGTRQMSESVREFLAGVRTFDEAVRDAAASAGVPGATVPGGPAGGAGGGLSTVASAVGAAAAVATSVQAAKGAANAAKAAESTAKAAGSKTSVTRSVSGGLNKVTAGMDLVNSARKGDVAGAANSGISLVSTGLFGAKAASAAAAAAPWLAGGLLVAGLVGGLFRDSGPHGVTKLGEGRHTGVGEGDHTGLIDSGYSGVDSLRRLEQQRRAATAGAGLAGGASVFAPSLAAGAIQIVTQPGQSAQEIAQEVIREIERKAALADAQTPSF